MNQRIPATFFLLLTVLSLANSITITARRTSQVHNKAVLFLVDCFDTSDKVWEQIKSVVESIVARLEEQNLVAIDVYSSYKSLYSTIWEFFLPQNETYEIPPAIPWSKASNTLNINDLRRSSIHGTKTVVNRANRLLDDIIVSRTQRYVVLISGNDFGSVTSFKYILKNKPQTTVSCFGFGEADIIKLRELASSTSYGFFLDNVEETVESFQKVFKGKSDFFKKVTIQAHIPEDFQLSTSCNFGVKPPSNLEFDLVLTIKNSHKDECISSGGEIEIYEIQRNEPFFGDAAFSVNQEIPPRKSVKINASLVVLDNYINNIPHHLVIMFRDETWGQEKYILELEARIFSNELHKAVNKIKQPLHILLLGPSGVGKSTLINSMASLLKNETKVTSLDPACSGDRHCTQSTRTRNLSFIDPKMDKLIITDTSGLNYTSSLFEGDLNSEFLVSLIKGNNNSIPIHVVIMMVKFQLLSTEELNHFVRIQDIYTEIRKLDRNVFFVASHLDLLNNRVDLQKAKEKFREMLNADSENFLCGSFTRSNGKWDVEAQFNTFKILDEAICNANFFLLKKYN